MKTRTLTLAALLTLLVSAVAMAETNKFSTSLKDDGQAVGKISFKVKTNKKGTAVKVTSIKVSKLSTQCFKNGEREPGPVVNGSLGSAKVSPPAPKSGSKFYGVTFNKTSRGVRYRFHVLMGKKGRNASGGVIARVNRGSDECTRDAQYKAKRK